MFYRSCILIGLFVLLQKLHAEQPLEDIDEGNGKVFHMQKCMERLIEKILSTVEDFYTKIRNKCKCIPESVPDDVMRILKNSIACIDDVEKTMDGMVKDCSWHTFHKCFANGKNEVRELMNSIDPTLDYCPDNTTEKLYQINITSSFVRTFFINIKNGLVITRQTYITRDFADDDDKYPHVIDYNPENVGEVEYEDDLEDDFEKVTEGNESLSLSKGETKDKVLNDSNGLAELIRRKRNKQTMGRKGGMVTGAEIIKPYD